MLAKIENLRQAVSATNWEALGESLVKSVEAVVTDTVMSWGAGARGGGQKVLGAPMAAGVREAVGVGVTPVGQLAGTQTRVSTSVLQCTVIYCKKDKTNIFF